MLLQFVRAISSSIYLQEIMARKPRKVGTQERLDYALLRSDRRLRGMQYYRWHGRTAATLLVVRPYFLV